MTEAISSALPLLTLDAATGEQRVALQSRKPRPAEPSAWNDALVRELDPDGALAAPAALLVQTLAPVITKLRASDLTAHGVTRRDRVAEDSDHTLRRVVDRLARMLGAPECDIYAYDAPEPKVRLVLGEPIALLVPRTLAAMTKSMVVFGLAPRLFLARHELGAVDALPARELSILLAGAVRRQHAGYGTGLCAEGELDDASRAISKALPWLSRKRVDDAAAGLAQVRADQLEPWCERVRTIAARVALVLCDDLPGALELLAVERGLPSASDPIARDLLQLWASELAVKYRQRLGSA
jgi:hypothetical protein